MNATDVAVPPQPLAVDRIIADELDAHRDAIASAIVDHALRRTEVTLGAELTATAFVDRYIDALRERDWPSLYGWIDRMCDTRSAAGMTARLLGVGPSMALAYIDDAVLPTLMARADFAEVGERVMAIVGLPRASGLAVERRTLDEIDVKLDRLISRLDNFDPATAEHSRAVSMWCARIGKKLGLTITESTFVMRAGLIHDIGKVTTPPQILNAPHRLSDAQMDIMRRHAEAGSAIVGQIRRLEHLTPVVRAHHERIDGRGYPDGRLGSDIPLVARIVSVADSFNAMIGNRPYRLPMAPTLAIEQLRAHTGTQFDANVVNAMIDIIDR